jgi:hypothetical protein
VNSGAAVLSVADVGLPPLSALLNEYGLRTVLVADGVEIPGSYWGAPEAGLIELAVYVRGDTPVHSALHEACHAICMDPLRRAQLQTDAGGDFDEENAVCYLQILLADALPGVGADRLMTDMDAWGYTFRLGSTRAWFAGETTEEQRWLIHHGLLDPEGRPIRRLRQQ